MIELKYRKLAREYGEVVVLDEKLQDRSKEILTKESISSHIVNPIDILANGEVMVDWANTIGREIYKDKIIGDGPIPYKGCSVMALRYLFEKGILPSEVEVPDFVIIVPSTLSDLQGWPEDPSTMTIQERERVREQIQSSTSLRESVEKAVALLHLENEFTIARSMAPWEAGENLTGAGRLESHVAHPGHFHTAAQATVMSTFSPVALRYLIDRELPLSVPGLIIQKSFSLEPKLNACIELTTEGSWCRSGTLTPLSKILLDYRSHKDGSIRIDPKSVEGYIRPEIFARFDPVIAHTNQVLDLLPERTMEVESGMDLESNKTLLFQVRFFSPHDR